MTTKSFPKRKAGRPISTHIAAYTIPANKETSLIARPSKFEYRSCPRCEGTLYRPPAVYYFHCLVCGWEQQCNSCMGNVTMWDREYKGCSDCRTKIYVRVVGGGGWNSRF